MLRRNWTVSFWAFSGRTSPCDTNNTSALWGAKILLGRSASFSLLLGQVYLRAIRRGDKLVDMTMRSVLRACSHQVLSLKDLLVEFVRCQNSYRKSSETKKHDHLLPVTRTRF